jgi:hypothetical protein
MREVAQSAQTCPHCGHILRQQETFSEALGSMCGCIVAAFVILWLLGIFFA